VRGRRRDTSPRPRTPSGGAWLILRATRCGLPVPTAIKDRDGYDQKPPADQIVSRAGTRDCRDTLGKPRAQEATRQMFRPPDDEIVQSSVHQGPLRDGTCGPGSSWRTAAT
jgi:hypothetical protein